MIRKKVRNILVPIDGSKNSFRGLDNAIYIARQCHAVITGLYVIPVYPKNFFDVVIPYQVYFKKEAKKFMAKARKLAAQRGILFKPKMIYGSPSAEILDLAKPKKHQLIVIGSRGQSVLKEAFMGSVASAVVHRSKIPVIVVK